MVRRASKYMAALVLVLSGAAIAWGQSVPGATLTVSGSEHNSGSVWDTGSISVTVNGYVKTLSGYGQYSTPASLASWMAARLSADTSSPVWAKATGTVITLVARTGEAVTASGTTTYDTGHFGTPSFTFTADSISVTPTPYLSLHCTRTTMGTGQSANCVAEIEGASALYGAPAATSDIVFTINAGPWVSVPVSPDGSATATGLTESSAGNYIIRADYPGDSFYSVMHATTTVVVGSPATLTGVYSYSITDSSSGSGYDPVGNIVAYADLIQGQWTLSYDSLNRLKGASSSPAIISGMPNLCWSYDSFGNRKQQYLGASSFSGGGTTACSGGGSSPAMQDQTYGTNNRLASDSTISTSFGFDASGEMTSDGSGTHQYSYDAEGRVCAMAVGISEIHYYGYLYDAEGRRVAKGTISNLDCSLVNGDGFTVTEAYIIGPDGSTMTELDGTGGWKHTDVPAGPGTMAVYDDSGLHFRFSDWLGSHRVQTNFNAATVEDTYQNLPFGEPVGSAGGATEKHFTGKEHDDESGNDYFNARYYASGFGRFMSPDPLPWIHWQQGNEDDQKKFEAFIANPQNLNMYAYVLNNPLNKTDPTGMNACGTNNDSNCNVTVTITDRGKDGNGHYNDQYTGVKNQGNYNATATVTVNGKTVGTYLVKTTPSDASKSATIRNGTYAGTLTTHNGQLAIRLQPTMHIPTIGPNPSRSDGASFAQGILVHKAGIDNFTGVGRNGKAVSEGCQVVCSTQYPDFLRSTGMHPDAGSPQQHFTVNVNTLENTPQ